MIDKTGGLRLMKAYWVVNEVSEGLGGWMGIRGRLEGIMEGLGMVHAIRLSHSSQSQSFHPYQSFHPCQNSPISASFHLESPSRTSLLPYIHSIILSCIVFPSFHDVHDACELPIGDTCTAYAWRVYGWYIGYRIGYTCRPYMHGIRWKGLWYTLAWESIFNWLGRRNQ